MTHQVTYIPGDYTGEAIGPAVRGLIAATGTHVSWDTQVLPADKIPDALVSSIRNNKTALMGFQHAWRDDKRHPPIVDLRKALGMYANIRPVRTLHGVPTRHEDLDLVIVREVTEDIYAHLEHESIPGVFESLKVTTRPACERIARFAFEYARNNGRKKVTIVHKANIMKKSDGLFLKAARDIATEYPDIQTDDVIVDALCMKLVIQPYKFDVLVSGNLYGDILSDLCAGLAGGTSNCPSINVGPDVRIFASPHGDPSGLPSTQHGNLLALLLPACELLKHLGEASAAERLWTATESVLVSGVRPYAIGGTAGVEELAAKIRAAL